MQLTELHTQTLIDMCIRCVIQQRTSSHRDNSHGAGAPCSTDPYAYITHKWGGQQGTWSCASFFIYAYLDLSFRSHLCKILWNPCEQASWTLRNSNRLLCSDCPGIALLIIFPTQCVCVLCCLFVATQSHRSPMLILLHFAASLLILSTYVKKPNGRTILNEVKSSTEDVLDGAEETELTSATPPTTSYSSFMVKMHFVHYPHFSHLRSEA